MDLALFDFDGTITTRETFVDFVRFAAPRHRWVAGKLLLAPLVIGYKAGWVSGHAIRASAIRVGLAGIEAHKASALGERFATEVLPNLLRPQALERIAWHRDRGDRIVVVSGALEVFLARWCAHHDIEVVCSRLAIHGGRLTGFYEGSQCVAEEKVRRVREAMDVSKYNTVYAYGDTSDDFAMLRLAHHASFRWHEWRDPEAVGLHSAVRA